APVGRKRPGSYLQRWPVQQHGGLSLIAEQRFEFAPQFFIAAAGLRQKVIPLIRIQVSGGIVQLLNPIPPVRIHALSHAAIGGPTKLWRPPSRARPSPRKFSEPRRSLQH